MEDNQLEDSETGVPSPGPYTLDEEALGGVTGCRTIIDVEGNDIAHTVGLNIDSEDEANAFLFAASWEMLGTLRKALNQFRQTGTLTNATLLHMSNVIKTAEGNKMFDIEHMKKAREQGVMLVPSEVDELILWAYDRRNIQLEMSPEMMRAVQMKSELGAYAAANLTGAYDMFREFWQVAISVKPSIDRAGIGQPFMLPPSGNVGYALVPPVAALDLDAVPGSGPFVALVAPAAPAVGQAAPSPSMLRKIRLNQSFGKLGNVPASTDDAHIEPNAIVGRLYDRYVNREFDANAKALDTLLPRYDSVPTLGTNSATMMQMSIGNYYARADVLSLFDIAD